MTCLIADKENPYMGLENIICKMQSTRNAKTNQALI